MAILCRVRRYRGAPFSKDLWSPFFSAKHLSMSDHCIGLSLSTSCHLWLCSEVNCFPLLEWRGRIPLVVYVFYWIRCFCFLGLHPSLTTFCVRAPRLRPFPLHKIYPEDWVWSSTALAIPTLGFPFFLKENLILTVLDNDRVIFFCRDFLYVARWKESVLSYSYLFFYLANMQNRRRCLFFGFPQYVPIFVQIVSFVNASRIRSSCISSSPCFSKRKGSSCPGLSPAWRPLHKKLN